MFGITMLSFSKDTAINILIIVSLVFFIGMTMVLIGLFIVTDVIHYDSSSDIILTVGVFAGWIAFISAVLYKAISIYMKLPKGDIMEKENGHKSRKGF